MLPPHGYPPGPTTTRPPWLLRRPPLPVGSPLQPLWHPRLLPPLPIQLSHTSLLPAPHLRPFARLFYGQKFLPRYPRDSASHLLWDFNFRHFLLSGQAVPDVPNALPPALPRLTASAYGMLLKCLLTVCVPYWNVSEGTPDPAPEPSTGPAPWLGLDECVRPEEGEWDSGATSGAVVMVLGPFWAQNSGFHENVC